MQPQRPRSTSTSSRRSPSPIRQPVASILVPPEEQQAENAPFEQGGKGFSTHHTSHRWQQWWAAYRIRLKGEGKVAPSIRPVASIDPLVTVFLCGATLFILVAIQVWGFSRRGIELSTLITSFGASSGMVFGATQVHASQPRGIIGGFIIGGLFGVISNNIFRHAPHQDIAMGLGAALSVACSLTVMKITSLIHPPGCSAAIFAASMMSYNEEFQDYGFIFMVTPVLLGSVVLVICGWLGNNAFPWRKHYPSEW
jgi:CBS-domain-containing membrane protein